MKLFQCTVEAYPNNCYVRTLLIIADDEKDAENQIINKRRNQDKGSGRINPTYEIKYTQPLKEIKIDLSKKGILEVGFGSAEDDNDSDD
jgi:diphthamide synthase subunit DPH2